MFANDVSSGEPHVDGFMEAVAQGGDGGLCCFYYFFVNGKDGIWHKDSL